MIHAERFRALLENERIKARGLVADLRAEIAAAGASGREVRLDAQDPEGASTIFELSKQTSLLALEVEHVEEIDAALDRIVKTGPMGSVWNAGNQ